MSAFRGNSRAHLIFELSQKLNSDGSTKQTDNIQTVKRNSCSVLKTLRVNVENENNIISQVNVNTTGCNKMTAAVDIERTEDCPVLTNLYVETNSENNTFDNSLLEKDCTQQFIFNDSIFENVEDSQIINKCSNLISLIEGSENENNIIMTQLNNMNNTENNTNNKSDVIESIDSSLLDKASLVILAIGCATGWISPTLKKLESGDHPLLTPDQGSWIAAMHEPGHLIAALPAGILVSRWGPLSCLRIAGSFSVLGWILTLIKVKFWVLCAARICFGVSMGVAFTVVPLYVGEIASPKVRGVLGVMFQSMLYLGHLIEFILGPWLSYVQLALVSLVIPITFLITTFFMVESPYFLLKDGRYDDAGHAYSRLSGETKLQCIELQLHQMQEMLDQSSSYSRGTIKDIFLSGHNRDALLVVLFLAIAQRFSGMSAVVAYASSTFPNTTGGLNASQYTILFGAAVFIFTLVSGIFIDSRGRRPLTLISCAGCCIAELLAAIYYYCFMKTNQYSWIPVVVISCYSCFYSIGLGPVVNVLQGELFAPSVKGISSSIVTVVHASSSFIVTKMSQTIRKHFGIYVQFAIFSFSCFIAFIFGYFCVPETKQKTLQEVQDDAVRNR